MPASFYMCMLNKSTKGVVIILIFKFPANLKISCYKFKHNVLTEEGGGGGDRHDQ